MISVVVLTHQNASTIDDTLKQLKWAKEVIVLDDSSTDETALIARAAGATVIQHPVSEDFSYARNLAMKEATYDWILFIDSDETIDATCLDALQSIDLSLSIMACYQIRRVDEFWKTRVSHGEVWTAAHTGIVRLVQRTRGEWKGKVHERFVPTGLVGTLSGYIIHRPHQSITHFLESINQYSTLRAQELKGKLSKKKAFSQLMVYPWAKFVYTYFLKLGFLDGPAGYVYSFMMSFHSFLVRAKVIVAHDTM